MSVTTLNGRPAKGSVIPIKPPARKAGAESRSPARRGGTRRRRRPDADTILYASATAAPWGLAILLLAVSMPHLAEGFESITRCGPVAGWLLAIAIDASQVFAKLQLTLSQRYTISPAARWTATGIVGGTAVMSMALNVLAFLAGATDTTGSVLAWAAGIMLPLLVLALSYTGSCFALAEPTPKARGRR